MKVKLIYTGNPNETKVVNAETGEPIENVVSATINLDAFGCTAILEIASLEFEVDQVEAVMEPYNDTR